jgi:sporulation protein YlmC with PRC-barrel domain
VDRYYKQDKAEKAPENAPQAKPGEESTFGSIFRASQVSGIVVKDEQNRQLGTIQELVFDLDQAKIRYAAISYGGLLGVGDKLFAVPVSRLKLAGIDTSPHFVSSINIESIKNAEGFDEDNWPNTADPRWSSQIDEYYKTGEPAKTPAKPSDEVDR